MNLFLRTLLGNLVLRTLLGNLFPGTLPGTPCLRTYSWKPFKLFCNLFLETCSWEPCLETCSWEPCLATVSGTLAWEPCLGTCSWEPGLGIVPGNLACEPVPGKFEEILFLGWLKTPNLRCWGKTFPSIPKQVPILD